MSVTEHRRNRRRLVRTLLLAGTLTATSLIASPLPASAGVSGCALTSKKPGITVNGLKAYGKFSFTCIVGGLPFQYRIAVWEQDAGTDQQLSLTAWLDATLPSSGVYEGQGPRILCQTEAGTEELYTRIRTRVGSPGNYETTPWESSALLTTKTCQ